MTRQAIRGIGYCARMNAVGDWAFNFALDLAVDHDVQLDVFFFPEPPTQPHAPRGRAGEQAGLTDDQRIALERDVRLYYDQLAGEFVKVGFRLCEGDEEPELQRCLLVRREYDVLVLAYEGLGCAFGSRTIEEFANRMPCPTVLVGPTRPDQVFLNAPAVLYADALRLGAGEWTPIGAPSAT